MLEVITWKESGGSWGRGGWGGGGGGGGEQRAEEVVKRQTMYGSKERKGQVTDAKSSTSYY